MHKGNRWKGGGGKFILPPLPENLKDTIGCSLEKAIFDPKVGFEMYLEIREDPKYCDIYCTLDRINLNCKTGIGRANSGEVAFFIFSLFNRIF